VHDGDLEPVATHVSSLHRAT